MSLWRIAWRSIQQRGLASVLTSLSMALGVMLIVFFLLGVGVISESFRKNSSLGYNMIVGAKGGRLQLVLNTVYYLSAPVENIPYLFYQEFLPAAARGDGQDGKFALFTDLAIPVCLGDYYKTYRVVGTTPQMFDNFVYDAERGQKYTFAQGRNFQTYSEQHGYFEAVVGAVVARETRLELGDAIAPTHGPEGEAHDVFHVVGILAPSGTPIDRAVFVNIEGFYLLEGHAKPREESPDKSTSNGPVDDTQQGEESPATSHWQPIADDAAENSHPEPPRLRATAAPAATHASPDRRSLAPLPIEQREVTAILLRSVNSAVTPGLRNTINEGNVAQAVLPIAEIYTLFTNFVTPLKMVLLLLTGMVCVVSGISILVSIYNSMSDRRREIAIMRALGAGRQTVMAVVLLESIMLSLGGGLMGWTAGHLLIGAANPLIEGRTGVSIGVFDLAPPIQLENIVQEPIIGLRISSELFLIPALILLAILVGFLPALAAYRTDVARTLSATP